MRDITKRATAKHIGPGGVKCPCCNRLTKAELSRMARRKAKSSLKDLLN